MNRLLIALSALLLVAAGPADDPMARGDFVIPEANAIQARPSIAYDPGSDLFLTTWSDNRNAKTTGLDVYGRLVDAQGRPASPDIEIARASRGQGLSAVAFDPERGRYLVVWTDWRDAAIDESDIYGRFVRADGTLDGPAFPISSERVSQKFPNVAFDPANRRFLVAWGDFREGRYDKIYARFVHADGRMDGEAFRVTAEGGYQEHPSVAYDSKRQRFFVVWRDQDATGRGIYGTFIAAASEPDRGRIEIAIEDDGCLPPSLYAVAYSPVDDVIMVAWTSGWNYAKLGLDVYGSLLDGATGKVRAKPFPIAKETDYQESAAVTYDANHNRFLVVWYDLRRDSTALNMDIYGRFVTTRGKMEDEFLVSNYQARGLKRYPALAFSPRSDNFLILWEDGRDGRGPDRQIRGAVR